MYVWNRANEGQSVAGDIASETDATATGTKRRKGKSGLPVAKKPAVEPDEAAHSSGDVAAVPNSILKLAKATELTKEEQDKLYAAVKRQFPSSLRVTRSMMEAWIRDISDENMSYLLIRRNMETASVMLDRATE